MSENNSKPITINISTTTILKITGIFLIFLFLYLVREIAVILFVSIILASAISPLIDFFEKRRIPRSLGVIVVYLILFLIFALVIGLLIPPLTNQISQLAKNFPFYWEKILRGFTTLQEYSAQKGFLDNIQRSLQSLELSFQQATAGVFAAISSIFGNIISFIIILVITFYISVQAEEFKKSLLSLVPKKYHPYLINLSSRMQEKISAWVKGQLILCAVIAFLSFIGLTILGVKYALVLALVAGLFELIPYLGPVLGAIPAVFLAFAQSPWKAMMVVVLYFFIQQLENNFIVPKVMHKTVGLNPILIIVVMLIGAKIAGILGLLLAIPVTTALVILVRDFLEKSEINIPSVKTFNKDKSD